MRILQNWKLWGVVLIVSFFCHSIVLAATDSFTPAQRAEIEGIVHNYLVTHPEVLVEVSQALQKKQRDEATQQALKAIPKIAKQLFFDANSPIEGNAKGNVSVVEFFDYQCPHCKHMTPVLGQVMASYPNVRVVYKELPIFGDDSMFAAKAALAAGKQGRYVVMHRALMSTSTKLTSAEVLKIAGNIGLDLKKLADDMKDPKIEQQLKDNFNLANDLNLGGTPAFVIVKTPDANKPETVDTSKATFVPGATNAESLAKAVMKAGS